MVRVTVVSDARGAVQQLQRASHHHYQEGKILRAKHRILYCWGGSVQDKVLICGLPDEVTVPVACWGVDSAVQMLHWDITSS